MTPAARVQAAIEILERIRAGDAAEKALTGWARHSRFAGSKDRAAVRDHVFGVLRRWRSCAALGGAWTGRGLMLGALRQDGVAPETLFTGTGHAPLPLSAEEAAAGRPPEQGAEALDLPDWIWPQFQDSLGDAAAAVAEALRHRAPVHLRVNTARIGRDEAQARLADEGIATVPHPAADTALEVVDGARRIRQAACYRDGLVELQDAASQAVVADLPLADGMRVLDFCAGGGGKALAMAARAQIDLVCHDADPARMRDLPDRARRAGAAVSLADTTDLRQEGGFDLVLADAPCSGSGSWRRAPEGKWRLTPDRLIALTTVQAQILCDIAGLIAPDGVLAYATCSVLTTENEDRVTAFLNQQAGWTRLRQRRWFPDQGADGFFISLLQLTGRS